MFGKRNQLIGAISLYVLGLIGFAIVTYQQLYQHELDSLDARLEMAAMGLVHILGEDFHDRDFDEDTISVTEDHQRTLMLTEYINDIQVTFVYAIIKKGDYLYFTASNATEEEIENNQLTNYFIRYDEASQELIDSFETKQTFYEETLDRWGHFRSILIPLTTARGMTYVVGADMRVETLDDIAERSFLRAAWVALYFTLLVTPLALSYILSTRRETTSLRDRLYRDTLTGLPNRNRLKDDVRIAEVPTVALFNVDSFQEITDFYGHDIGDAMLIRLASRLHQLCSETFGPCLIYRLHADEYALLLTTAIHEQELTLHLHQVAEQLNTQPLRVQQHDINFSVTIGAAIGHPTPLIRADMALRSAKKQNYEFLLYNQTLRLPETYEQNLQLTQELRDALQQGRVIPYFQPIVNASTGQIEKYECLARLIKQDGDMVSPAVFLPIARRARLYPQITRRMIDASIARFKGTTYRFSLNLGIEDISNPDTIEYLQQAIQGSSIAQQLEIELLESEHIKDYGEVQDFVELCAQLGCKVGIDDFGSGYCNFEHLANLAVAFVKIDGSLVRQVNDDASVRLIIETILTYSKRRRLVTVAEYCSDAQISRTMAELGVDFLQGYHHGAPSRSLDPSESGLAS